MQENETNIEVVLMLNVVKFLTSTILLMILFLHVIVLFGAKSTVGPTDWLITFMLAAALKSQVVEMLTSLILKPDFPPLGGNSMSTKEPLCWGQLPLQSFSEILSDLQSNKNTS